MLIALFFVAYPYIIMAFGTMAAAAAIIFGAFAAGCLIFLKEPTDIIMRMFGGALIFAISCGVAGMFISWMKWALERRTPTWIR